MGSWGTAPLAQCRQTQYKIKYKIFQKFMENACCKVTGVLEEGGVEIFLLLVQAPNSNNNQGCARLKPRVKNSKQIPHMGV